MNYFKTVNHLSAQIELKGREREPPIYRGRSDAHSAQSSVLDIEPAEGCAYDALMVQMYVSH